MKKIPEEDQQPSPPLTPRTRKLASYDCSAATPSSARRVRPVSGTEKRPFQVTCCGMRISDSVQMSCSCLRAITEQLVPWYARVRRTPLVIRLHRNGVPQMVDDPGETGASVELELWMACEPVSTVSCVPDFPVPTKLG